MKREIQPGTIRLIVTDVDGIWTDGAMYLDAGGNEMLRFSVYDGLAIKVGREAGLEFALLSARRSRTAAGRASQLGIACMVQGSRDKKSDLESICRQLAIPPSATLYMGDDLNDLPVFRNVAIAVSVPNAPLELQREADRVTRAAGGNGAIREVVEWVLREAGQWDRLVAGYLEPEE